MLTLPLMDILVKYVFELRKTFPNKWWKIFLPAYCHFKEYVKKNSFLVDVASKALDVSEHRHFMQVCISTNFSNKKRLKWMIMKEKKTLVLKRKILIKNQKRA